MLCLASLASTTGSYPSLFKRFDAMSLEIEMMTIEFWCVKTVEI